MTWLHLSVSIHQCSLEVARQFRILMLKCAHCTILMTPISYTCTKGLALPKALSFAANELWTNVTLQYAVNSTSHLSFPNVAPYDCVMLRLVPATLADSPRY